jgi:hypothetical protein
MLKFTKEMNQEIFYLIFPQARGKNFEEINLNELVKHASADGQNYKLPQVKQRLIDRHHMTQGCVTYGGWLEDRAFMWKGTYMDNDQRYIHLGVDINLPLGTQVRSPADAEVHDVLCDDSAEVGWGTRIILKPEIADIYLVFAHLSQDNNLRAGQHIDRGAIIGTIGTWPQNGNVFQHTHIQAVAAQYLETHPLSELDGYGQSDASLAQAFPEPCPSWKRS